MRKAPTVETALLRFVQKNREALLEALEEAEQLASNVVFMRGTGSPELVARCRRKAKKLRKLRNSLVTILQPLTP